MIKHPASRCECGSATRSLTVNHLVVEPGFTSLDSTRRRKITIDERVSSGCASGSRRSSDTGGIDDDGASPSGQLDRISQSDMQHDASATDLKLHATASRLKRVSPIRSAARSAPRLGTSSSATRYFVAPGRLRPAADSARRPDANEGSACTEPSDAFTAVQGAHRHRAIHPLVTHCEVQDPSERTPCVRSWQRHFAVHPPLP